MKHETERSTLRWALCVGAVLTMTLMGIGVAAATGNGAPSWCNLPAHQLGEDSKDTCRGHGYSYDDVWVAPDNSGHDDPWQNDNGGHDDPWQNDNNGHDDVWVAPNNGGAPSWCTLPAHQLGEDSKDICRGHGYTYGDVWVDDNTWVDDNGHDDPWQNDNNGHDDPWVAPDNGHDDPWQNDNNGHGDPWVAPDNGGAPSWCTLPAHQLGEDSKNTCRGHGYTYDNVWVDDNGLDDRDRDRDNGLDPAATIEPSDSDFAAT